MYRLRRAGRIDPVTCRADPDRGAACRGPGLRPGSRGTLRLMRKTALAALVAAALPMAAHATPLLWSGTIDSVGVSGQVEFQVVAGNLQITLENTTLSQPTSTKQILTGVLFDIGGSGSALGMQSAAALDGIVNAGSTTPGSIGLNICAPGIGGTALGNTCGSTLVGGWQAGYWSGGANTTLGYTQRYGIGTAGLGLFNGGQVGSANYGIVSSLGTTVLDGLTGMQPYTYKRATFSLYGGSALDGITISNVQALYGTDLADIQPPNVVPPAQVVPEPAAVGLLGLGLLGLGWGRRKRG